MITEIIEFKTVGGVSAENVIEQMEATVSKFHKQQKGYVDSELMLDSASQVWKMLHHYQTMDDIKAVGQKVATDPVIRRFSEIVAPGSLNVLIHEHFGMWS